MAMLGNPTEHHQRILFGKNLVSFFVCFSVFLFVCDSVFLFVCVSVFLFVCFSVFLFVCDSVFLFVCFSVFLFVFSFFVCFSVFLFVFSFYLSVFPSFYLSFLSIRLILSLFACLEICAELLLPRRTQAGKKSSQKKN